MLNGNIDVSFVNILKWLLTLPLQSEVNAIKWDPSGFLLASCSDDNTAKVIPNLLCPFKLIAGKLYRKKEAATVPFLHMIQNITFYGLLVI